MEALSQTVVNRKARGVFYQTKERNKDDSSQTNQDPRAGLCNARFDKFSTLCFVLGAGLFFLALGHVRARDLLGVFVRCDKPHDVPLLSL